MNLFGFCFDFNKKALKYGNGIAPAAAFFCLN